MTIAAPTFAGSHYIHVATDMTAEEIVAAKAARDAGILACRVATTQQQALAAVAPTQDEVDNFAIVARALRGRGVTSPLDILLGRYLYPSLVDGTDGDFAVLSGATKP